MFTFVRLASFFLTSLPNKHSFSVTFYCSAKLNEHYCILLLCISSANMAIATTTRVQERPRIRLRPNPLKMPSIARAAPTAKHKHSLSSTDPSNVTSTNGKVRKRFYRGMSSIRSFFKSKAGESDSFSSDINTSQAVLITQKGAGFHSTPHLPKNPLRLQLSAFDVEREVLLRGAAAGIVAHDDNIQGQASPASSHSIGSLRRKISQRFLQAFSPPSPTIVVKPELRARPSVQTLAIDRSSTASGTLSLHSSSGTTQLNGSTPPTSEGTMSGSPGSVLRHDLEMHAPHEQLLVISEQSEWPRKLSTVHEVDGQQIATIRTVEATAAAK